MRLRFPTLVDVQALLVREGFLSAVLLFSVHVQFGGTPEDHVTRTTAQKLIFGSQLGFSRNADTLGVLSSSIS